MGRISSNKRIFRE
jgi:hypothetical protein